MAVVHITYTGDAGARFDRDYYRSHHLPLVMAAWRPYGLEDLAVLYPEDARATTIALCVCRFRDEGAVAACMASPGTPEVMADVARFTEIVPTQTRAVPL